MAMVYVWVDVGERVGGARGARGAVSSVPVSANRAPATTSP